MNDQSLAATTKKSFPFLFPFSFTVAPQIMSVSAVLGHWRKKTKRKGTQIWVHEWWRERQPIRGTLRFWAYKDLTARGTRNALRRSFPFLSHTTGAWSKMYSPVVDQERTKNYMLGPSYEIGRWGQHNSLCVCGSWISIQSLSSDSAHTFSLSVPIIMDRSSHKSTRDRNLRPVHWWEQEKRNTRVNASQDVDTTTQRQRRKRNLLVVSTDWRYATRVYTLWTAKRIILGHEHISKRKKLTGPGLFSTMCVTALAARSWQKWPRGRTLWPLSLFLFLSLNGRARTKKQMIAPIFREIEKEWRDSERRPQRLGLYGQPVADASLTVHIFSYSYSRWHNNFLYPRIW